MMTTPPEAGGDTFTAPRRAAGLLGALLGALLPLSASGAAPGEFIIFPNINTVYRDQSVDLAGHHSLPKDSTEPTVDFFYSRDFNKLRLISEFFVSSSKNHGAHFERLQIGWRLSRTAELWAGRFHNPVGYWNTQYHHGNYLETAISRPAIVSYEHDGGILPMHLVGLRLTGDMPRGEGVLGYDLGVGMGPELVEHGLDALDIIHPDGAREPVATLRLRYQPVEDAPSQYGFFFSRATIPGSGPGETKQTIAGAYFNQEGSALRLTGALFAIKNDLERGRNNRFFNGYLQVEKPFARRWTLFARAEGGRGENGDAYLKEIGAYAKERQLGGLRFDFRDYQALKIELSHNRYGSNYSKQVQLQWSAVLP